MSEEILFYTLLIILTLLFAARMIEKADKWMLDYYKRQVSDDLDVIIKLRTKLNGA